MFAPLRQALADQYLAFDSPRPTTVEGCECCSLPEELAALVAEPRERLTAHELEFYASNAVTTVGSVSDFRYYWPRLAELTVTDELLTMGEITFGKPAYGEHRDWPAPEREAIISFARAIGLWLGHERLEGRVDTLVYAIARLSDGLCDPVELLDPLLTDSDAARANLDEWLSDNVDDHADRHVLTNAFWGSVPDLATRLTAWLDSAVVQRARRSLA